MLKPIHMFGLLTFSIYWAEFQSLNNVDDGSLKNIQVIRVI